MEDQTLEGDVGPLGLQAAQLPPPKLVLVGSLRTLDGDLIPLGDGRLAAILDKAGDQAGQMAASVAHIVRTFAGGLASVEDADRPKKVVVELGFEVEGEGNICLIKAKGSASINLTLEWGD